MSTAIRFDHVSKRFTLHHQRPRSFQDLVIQFFKRNGGDAGQQREVMEGAGGQRNEEFWALRDVSFTVEHGETVGIIGPNGAGKSTALKLISRIIEPTSGEIEVNGRVGALLELGAGFHPDLSGRENIYLNGSVLGLKRSEINQKLERITTFAELERFIDMPIRHYSSGMRMRLGFSIAAHIDPEVLLVDEVLAVGDENFQHKCLDRIMEMRQQGVTIFFVSHGLGQVRRLCSRAIWLNNGGVQAEGGVDDVISAYLRFAADEEESRLRAAASPIDQAEKSVKVRKGGTEETAAVGELEIIDVSFLDADAKERRVFRVGEPWIAQLHYRSSKRIERPVFQLAIYRNDGLRVCGSNTHSDGLEIPSVQGEGSFQYRVDDLPLMEGSYFVSASIEDKADGGAYDERDRLHAFKVRQVGSGERYGLVSLGGRWDWGDGEPPHSTKLSQRAWDRSDGVNEARRKTERRWGAGDIDVVGLSFVDAVGRERRVFEAGEPWGVVLHYRAHHRIEQPVFGLAVHRSDGVHICGPNTHFGGLAIASAEGEGYASYQVSRLPLTEGTYLVSVSVHNQADTVMYDYHDRLYAFRVCQFGESKEDAVIILDGKWKWEGHG